MEYNTQLGNRWSARKQQRMSMEKSSTQSGKVTGVLVSRGWGSESRITARQEKEHGSGRPIPIYQTPEKRSVDEDVYPWRSVSSCSHCSSGLQKLYQQHQLPIDAGHWPLYRIYNGSGKTAGLFFPSFPTALTPNCKSSFGKSTVTVPILPTLS